MNWRQLAAIYFTHQFLIALASYLANIFFSNQFAPHQISAILIQGLNQWDAGWYTRIAQHGYDGQAAAFFPLYPLLIHLLYRLGLPATVAGILISNLSLAGILYLFFRLAALDYDRRTAVKGTWYLGLFPTSFFLSAVYTESLYLLLALLTFFFLRRRRWAAAGACGLLAAATRNVGVFLALPALWEYRQATGGKISKELFFVAAIPLGLLFFMAYLKVKLGNPLAFWTAQHFWERDFAWPWESLAQAARHLWERRSFSNTLVDLFFTSLAVVLFLLSLGKERPSYCLFTLAGILVPLSSPASSMPLLSMPRFTMVLFPIYLTMARLVKSEEAHLFVLATSAALLFFFHMLFAHGCWVA
ncbi:mannosyltransferase family protein [Desulfovirgula thermocuniculi]|uniref:mannosyltransferase family protein n=1 Tax=Desulfovirgula thermocuniculi TaxID=348842 RepID=UPI00042437C7|nr:mannosyltransferase family protein [Desulfovirgula thermocuniculi]